MIRIAPILLVAFLCDSAVDLRLNLLTVESQRAQNPTTQKVAAKLDEFGDILYSDKIARLDNARMMVRETGHKLFIVVYTTRRDLPGLNYRLRAQMKDYLVYSGGMDESLVVTVDGGLSSNLIQQLWIVPPGTTPTPHPEAFLPPLRSVDFTWKFDDFTFGNSDLGYGPSETDSFEPFADEVRRSKDAIAYVIYYSGYVTITEQHYDRRGRPVLRRKILKIDTARDARRAMTGIRKEIETRYELGAGRVRIANGGYRDLRSVELWVLPKTAHPPIATPNRFLKKRQNRER